MGRVAQPRSPLQKRSQEAGPQDPKDQFESGPGLAFAGAAVVGVVGVGWALSKAADMLRFR